MICGMRDGKWRGLAYWSAVSDGTELVDGLQLDYLGRYVLTDYLQGLPFPFPNLYSTWSSSVGPQAEEGLKALAWASQREEKPREF